MNNIVFIVGEYYPNFSAVGICCYNIAEEIAKYNKVTVICMKSYNSQIENEEYNGQIIIRVSHKWWDIRLKLNEKIKTTNGLFNKWYRLLLNGVRVKEYLQVIFSRVSIKRDLVNSYINALQTIKDPIDAVIPLCFPMEAVVAGMEYKRKDNRIKLIPYLFDPFVESHTLHRTSLNRKIKKKANINIEKNMFELSTKIFCMNQLYTHFEQLNFKKELLLFTEHPLIKRKLNMKCDKSDIDQEKIIITYTGVFDYYIRNPEYFLKLMTKKLINYNAELHLYTCGNCGSLIDKYVKEAKGKIINHGYVAKEKADEAITKSSILICVGNIDNSQVPSKIFEYMSVGKPIVLFYSNDNDANIKVLKDYSLCLFLKQDESLSEKNSKEFVEFCNLNKNMSLNFTEVEELYYYASPNFITKQIMNEIDSEEHK